ncbi:hypothetical protein ADUPG1_005804, partial [Aduncisulcus paluster]
KEQNKKKQKKQKKTSRKSKKADEEEEEKSTEGVEKTREEEEEERKEGEEEEEEALPDESESEKEHESAPPASVIFLVLRLTLWIRQPHVLPRSRKYTLLFVKIKTKALILISQSIMISSTRKWLKEDLKCLKFLASSRL